MWTLAPPPGPAPPHSCKTRGLQAPVLGEGDAWRTIFWSGCCHSSSRSFAGRYKSCFRSTRYSLSGSARYAARCARVLCSTRRIAVAVPLLHEAKTCHPPTDGDKRLRVVLLKAFLKANRVRATHVCIRGELGHRGYHRVAATRLALLFSFSTSSLLGILPVLSYSRRMSSSHLYSLKTRSTILLHDTLSARRTSLAPSIA